MTSKTKTLTRLRHFETFPLLRPCNDGCDWQSQMSLFICVASKVQKTITKTVIKECNINKLQKHKDPFDEVVVDNIAVFVKLVCERCS